VPTQKPKPCPQRKKLGKNVAALRRKCGLTQEGLAELAEVSAWYIQSVERGMNFPSLPVLTKIKAALECSWNRLFNGIDDTN
jgi:transcriptional regulator with XRE-family HTH domain